MGLGTLNDRVAGSTILDSFFNDIHSALKGDFVGRNASGVPAANQNLGTTAFPWGTGRFNTLIVNGLSIDPSLISTPVNVVHSGKVRTTSNQPAYITPSGASLAFDIKGATTNLVFDVNGTEVTIAADLTKSSLTAAPSTNNTCTVDDATATGQAATRLWGEASSRFGITVDAMGSEITALVGKYAAFKKGTEYFIALVESTTKLSHAFRGFFYDSSLAPIKRVTLTDNDTITLMKLGWVFAENNATTIDVTYNNPVWSFEAPSAPATGDYWYDLANKVWQRFDGASFQIINRTFVGYIVNDTTACVAARGVDFFANYAELNTLDIEKSTSEIAKGEGLKAVVNVAGNNFSFEHTLPVWNITTDLAPSADMYSATEQASTPYYMYLKDTGDTVISDIEPYFRADFQGAYHPFNPWRCVGVFFNNSSSDIEAAGPTGQAAVGAYYKSQEWNAYGSGDLAVFRWNNTENSRGGFLAFVDNATNGTSWKVLWPGEINLQLIAGRSAVCEFGFTLNVTAAADLDLAPSALTEAQRPFASVSSGAGLISEASLPTRLYIGDVIRVQGDPAQTTAAFAAFERATLTMLKPGVLNV